MPKFSKVLDVQTQGTDANAGYSTPIYIWALVDTEMPKVSRKFRVYGTGHPVLDIEQDSAVHVGTVQLHGGTLMFHVFDLGEA